MRITFYDLLRRLAENDLPEPVVEFGAGRAAGQTHLPQVRSLFPGREFTGTDMSPGLGVDQLQDLHHLGIRDGAIGTALMFDTIEHVANPGRGISELRRCLASNGVLLMTAPFLFPVHPYPSDYWRFTAEGMGALLSDFENSHAGAAGLRLFPHTVVGLAGGPDVDPQSWHRLSASVDEWLTGDATSWKERALALVPPVLAQLAYERYTSKAAHHPGKT